jgi:hypothetical protein
MSSEACVRQAAGDQLRRSGLPEIPEKLLMTGILPKAVQMIGNTYGEWNRLTFCYVMHE